MRYRVHVIADPDGSLGETLGEALSLVGAHALADAEATGYQWGVAIVDTEAATVDYGAGNIQPLEALRQVRLATSEKESK